MPRTTFARKFDLMDHQVFTAKAIDRNGEGSLVFSDPGTGKTLSVFEAFLTAWEKGEADQLIVLGPLSILQAAWGDDIDKYVDGFYYEVAYAKNRAKAFNSGAPVIITNHDAIKWLAEHREALDPNKRIWLAVDESTAFKNPTAQRTKALMSMAPLFHKRLPMTGTPSPHSVLDYWSQVFIADRGERLGQMFYRYRGQVADAIQVGMNAHAKKWEAKPGAIDMVTQSIADITIRFKLEDCVDIPPCTHTYAYISIPEKLRLMYDQLIEQSVLESESGKIVTAVHAASRSRKILQLLTGSVYDQDGEAVLFHTERAELVMQYVEERAPIAPCVVGFNFHHERDALLKEAKKRKLRVTYIDGTVDQSKRVDIVRAFQDGAYDAVLLHPQAAGHGLTFARARTLIWSSPTENAEHLLQLNARIYRKGQEHKTEIIMVAARDTREVFVYESNLQPKVNRQSNALNVFTDTTKASMDLPARPALVEEVD